MFHRLKISLLANCDWFVPAFFAAVLCFSHIHQGTLAVDAIRYASTAKHILDTGDWMNLYDPYRDAPYTNKPPLLLWLVALFFHVFGVSTFWAKFPAVLFVFLALLGMWKLTKRWGEAAALFALILLVANRSFARDLVDLNFDGLALAGAVAVLTACIDLVSLPKSFGVKSGALFGMGIALLLLSKPPYVIVIGAPILISALLAHGRHAMFMRWQALMALTVPILLACWWFLYAGPEYLDKAVENQIGSTLHLYKGFWNNLGTWIYSFGFTLAPLSLLGVLAVIREIRSGRLRPSQLKDSPDQAAILLLVLWFLTALPIMLYVTVRPRYLWIPLLGAAPLAGRMLSELLVNFRSSHVRRVMLAIALLFLLLIPVGGIRIHRENPVIAALRLTPELLEQRGTGICVEDANPEATRRLLRQTRLLVQLEFDASPLTSTAEEIPAKARNVLANDRCARTFQRRIDALGWKFERIPLARTITLFSVNTARQNPFPR